MPRKGIHFFCPYGTSVYVFLYKQKHTTYWSFHRGDIYFEFVVKIEFWHLHTHYFTWDTTINIGTWFIHLEQNILKWSLLLLDLWPGLHQLTSTSQSWIIWAKEGNHSHPGWLCQGFPTMNGLGLGSPRPNCSPSPGRGYLCRRGCREGWSSHSALLGSKHAMEYCSTVINHRQLNFPSTLAGRRLGGQP